MREHVRSAKRREAGFTLLEMLVVSAIILVVIGATLTLYVRANRVAVDQQQYVELQHDVRAAMYTIARDVRMAGAGLWETFFGYALQGFDNEAQGGAVTPDRLRIMGDIDEPLNLRIQTYQGSAATVDIDDFSLEQYPYPDSWYDTKVCLLLPNPNSPCRGGAFREISQVKHSSGGTLEGFNFSHGQAPGINPPGGLSDVCADSDYFDGGRIMFVDVNEYWLDVTGNMPGLTAGQNGYIGGGLAGILYVNKNGINYPLAQNVENLQFQYNGDLDNDGNLDGFRDWNNAWTLVQVARIKHIRLLILGRTRDPYTTTSRLAQTTTGLFKRPAMANTAAGTVEDGHKRFLLESTSEMRNLALSLYNTGIR